MDLKELLIVIGFVYIFLLIAYNPLYGVVASVSYMIGVFTGLAELVEELEKTKN